MYNIPTFDEFVNESKINEMNAALIASMNMILQTTKSKETEKSDMEKDMKKVSDWWSSLRTGEIDSYEDGEPLSTTSKKNYDLMKKIKDDYGVSFDTHKGIWKK